jgi:hypothetical protein
MDDCGCGFIWLTDQIRHHETAWDRHIGIANDDADAWLLYACGAGRRVLRDDGSGHDAIDGHPANRSQCKAEAANLNRSRSLRLPQQIGNLHQLRAEAFRDANMPFPPNHGSSSGSLREDSSRWNVGAIKAVVDSHLDTESFGFIDGFLGRQAFETRNRDFRSVDGKAHGHNRGGQRYQRQTQHQNHELKKTKQSSAYFVAASSAYSMTKSISAAFSSILETEQYLFFESATASSAAFFDTAPLIR